jgi:hypothetical protein
MVKGLNMSYFKADTSTMEDYCLNSHTNSTMQHQSKINKNLWEHPAFQIHNSYSFGQRGNIPRSNTQSLLLWPNSSNSYSFDRTAPVLTPSARQPLLPNPCSNNVVFIFYG